MLSPFSCCFAGGFLCHSCNNGARFLTAVSGVNHRRALCFRSNVFFCFFSPSPPELRIQREEEEEDDEEEDKDRQSLANTVQDIEEEQGQRSVTYNSTFTVHQQHGGFLLVLELLLGRLWVCVAETTSTMIGIYACTLKVVYFS